MNALEPTSSILTCLILQAHTVAVNFNFSTALDPHSDDGKLSRLLTLVRMWRLMFCLAFGYVLRDDRRNCALQVNLCGVHCTYSLLG